MHDQMSFHNTLQDFALIKTTSVGRPHSRSWGGGRLDWEEGRRHFSSGRQLPPGWRTFTHFVAYHAFYDLFKIPKITEAELNELSRWSRRPCLSSSLRPTTSTSRSAPFLTFSTSKSFILTPGSLGPHLQGCCQQDQRWVFIAQQSIIKTGKSVEELRDIFNFDNLTATLDATLEEEVLIFPPWIFSKLYLYCGRCKM